MKASDEHRLADAAINSGKATSRINQAVSASLSRPTAIEPTGDLQATYGRSGGQTDTDQSRQDSLIPDTSHAISTRGRNLNAPRAVGGGKQARACRCSRHSEASARADRAEQGREDERARADALRGRHARCWPARRRPRALQRAETAGARANRPSGTRNGRRRAGARRASVPTRCVVASMALRQTDRRPGGTRSARG